MRKGILFTWLCLLLCVMPLESKTNEIRFVIVFDSNETAMIERKKEIVELMTKTLENISEKSQYDFLVEASDELEMPGRSVFFKKGVFYFFMGDHKGTKIEGTLVKNSFCMAEVKPKSFLRKLFNF